MESLPGDESASAPKMKDPKSFTQNLFDTFSLRMAEWLPLRRSPETYDKRPHYLQAHPVRSAKSVPRRDQGYSRSESFSGQERPFVPNGPGNNAHALSSRVPGHPAAVELKLPNQHVKRLSLTEIDQRQSPRSSLEEKSLSDRKSARKSARKSSVNTHAGTDEFVSMHSPPPLRRRRQKHWSRASDTKDGYLPDQQKKQRRVSWDGTKLLDESQCPKGHVVHPIPQDRFPMVQSPSEGKPRNKDQHHMPNALPPAETVTHLSNDIVDGLGQMMVQSEEDARNWKEELAFMELTGGFDDPEWRFATPRQRQVFNFVAQTVFYALSSSRQVLRSFRKGSASHAVKQSASDTSNTHLDVQQLQPAFRRLFAICPWDIALQSLWTVLEKAFVPPKELSTPSRQSRRSWGSSMAAPVSAPTVLRRASDPASDEHISDASAADIATVAFFALVSYLPRMDAQTWRGLVRMRAIGTVASDADMRKLQSADTGMVVEATDKLEHELALRLVNRLVRALTARLAFHGISKACEVYSHDSPKQRRHNVLDLVMDNLSEHYDMITSGANDHDHAQPSTQPLSASALIVEWIRTLFLREWDGKAQIPRSSAAGGAVQILSSMYKERHRIGLVPDDFHTAFLAERLDPLEMPVEWQGSLSNNKTMHLLSYSFLFPPSALVVYFRALNYSAMSKYFEDAMTTTRHITQTAFGAIQISDDVGFLARMKTSMTTYLVLVVRRDNVLTDALNQLWRREKRELMRPLKVQMGMDEGEEGVDHGGVQQEFFRVLLAEVLDPSYGMFTMDSGTRTSWFQPCSWEPLYKFELLGLLMSLAIYNGLTLPVNFPVAFYRKLLGLKVKHLDHIRDGWPELAKGLEVLLGWKEGDVGDVFMRTYEFSFEAFGHVETVDMQRVDRDAMWPLPPKTMPPETAAGPFATWSEVAHYSDRANLSPPSSMAAEATELGSSGSLHGDVAKPVDEAIPVQSPTPPIEEPSLVTNVNRHQFVKDYIFWLTDKSIRPQFEAFMRGFHTCLDRSALSIFTPEALKTVVEGIQEINVKELERHARYEGGFGPSHRVIREFWSVVNDYSTEKKAQLLEFVTASDRVPVNGIESIMFVVQKNGVGDTRLPTSLTCFGRLLLPEYSSREVLREKLDKALENARGFGVA
ncbi:HECT domain protein [Aspergillus sp. HF37]|nr:HECT domain protein [Aspergillus sp. HF37]